MPVPTLGLAGLSVAFGGLAALDGVTLSLAPGERRAVIGPNGAGKTTLFNLIAGEVKPSAGQVRLFGQDVTRLAPYRRAALGLARTFQVNTLFPGLTVMENLLLAVQGSLPRKLVIHRPIASYPALGDRAREVLEAVGLSGADEMPVAALSHGEGRQLEIAMALAGRPKLLLLDEPTAGLSASESQLLTRMLEGLDPGMTLLLIEHDMDVAFQLARRATVLHNGKVIADGDCDQVRRDPLVAEIYLGAE